MSGPPTTTLPSSSSAPMGPSSTPAYPPAPAPAAATTLGPTPASAASYPAPAVSTEHPLSQSEGSEARPSGDEGKGVVGAGSGEVGTSTPPVPKVYLRVLVISGQTHMFSFEPELTVGRMKELIWSMWPSEWTSVAQPPSPAFLRILFAGRILQDDTSLGSNNMPATITPSTPTVIHISVRSFSIRGEEDPKKGFLHPTTSRTRHASGENEVSGCKCIIM